MRTLERLAEARPRFGAVSDRQRGEADAAERSDQPPAVVALGEGVVAGASEPQGLGIVAQPERARTRAAERVTRSPDLADGSEQFVRGQVQPKRVAVALLGVGEEAQLARTVRA